MEIRCPRLPRVAPTSDFSGITGLSILLPMPSRWPKGLFAAAAGDLDQVADYANHNCVVVRYREINFGRLIVLFILKQNPAARLYYLQICPRLNCQPHWLIREILKYEFSHAVASPAPTTKPTRLSAVQPLPVLPRTLRSRRLKARSPSDKRACARRVLPSSGPPPLWRRTCGTVN